MSLQTKDVMFRLRLTAEEFAEWSAAAKREGDTMSAWVRRCVYARVPATVVTPKRKVVPKPEPAPPVDPVRPPVVPLEEPVVTPADTCKRCGHKRESHWVKGCLAGCPCSESRYRE